MVLAKFIRTATVFAGWMTAQPSIPPSPDVANTTGLLILGGFVDDLEDMVIRLVKTAPAAAVPGDDGAAVVAEVPRRLLLLLLTEGAGDMETATMVSCRRLKQKTNLSPKDALSLRGLHWTGRVGGVWRI